MRIVDVKKPPSGGLEELFEYDVSVSGFHHWSQTIIKIDALLLGEESKSTLHEEALAALWAF